MEIFNSDSSLKGGQYQNSGPPIQKKKQKQMEVPPRLTSCIRQKNVVNYLESQSDDLLKDNNVIIKTLTVDFLSGSIKEAWEKVQTNVDDIKLFAEKRLPYVLAYAMAIDYSNSTYKDKKSGENKKSSDYGLPYLNIVFFFKNSAINEENWEKFVKEYNDEKKYPATKDLAKKNAKNETWSATKIMGFIIKNHDNKHLIEKLKKNPIEIMFPNTKQRKEYEKIRNFFEKLQNLGIKLTIIDSNEKEIKKNETTMNDSNKNEESVPEKTSRPNDSPFMKFIFELTDYMKLKQWLKRLKELNIHINLKVLVVDLLLSILICM